jgi:phosphopantothenoylcysteine decarboxylase/phosphopantothenate--cysteine ligase
MKDLSQKHIVLGLSGGIACYKAAELCRLLIKAGASVQVVMTQAATQFITPVTMQALSGREVFISQWDDRQFNNMAHINLTRAADAILIAPASADFMAKLIHGRADDLLSLLCLARPVQSTPLILAPAMNREMWSHPATQRNVSQLRQDGAWVLGVAQGDQACGETGDGRMLEPEDIFEDLCDFFEPQVLASKRVLINAGPTFEPIDPVRGLTNLSSGKMGFALAKAARAAGASVTLVSGPVHLSTPRGVRRVDVQTAKDMHDQVLLEAEHADVFIATAAVADWRVKNYSTSKLKKGEQRQPPQLEFEENPDILSAVAHGPRALSKALFCVGFSAESHDLLKHASEKRIRKGVPLMVGNLGPMTFGRDDNELLLIDENGVRTLERNTKEELARLLVADVAQRLSDFFKGQKQ